MISSPRRARLRLGIAIGCVFAFAFVYKLSSESSWHLINDSSGSKAPANATLGFGGIYVVSGSGSERLDNLEQAAAVTELNLTIPTQKEWTDADVLNFRWKKAPQKSKIGAGSIKSWLSHRLVLQEFLDSGLETALIIEDDVDWDIRLRSQQIPLTQRAARDLLDPRSKSPKKYPWGEPHSWDVLWLGHCGDYWNEIDLGVGVGHHHPEQLNRMPHAIWPDETVSYFTNLHPYTASLLSALRVPEKHRVLHKSMQPLCSFGYAVTRTAAEKLLSSVVPAREEDLPEPPAYAYDQAMMFGCFQLVIRCYSLQPELFHHMLGESLVGKSEEHHWLSPVDVAGSEQLLYRGETSNIDCGFWSGNFWWNGDEKKLDFLRREVGRKGRCLKPGRDT
ncbi:hypothetical protein BDY17DRAFT_317307 [Neohortaea acidophila]|uniref:Glycosyltransferase family 25 protein n=1 Tax=Neohortaea acidophila TaxID=245834 RepID=A0A6A6PRJ6_9PEZI|nr:uncharacterized protein BDY17DRAFT_317307 [Neohortaea acidophila]KAF2482730.1 hypothetical protein BDY17DRAFT_317307 [Neohortaea acidophila]